MTRPIPRLVALSPGDLTGGGRSATRPFLRSVERAVEAGLRGVLLREPLLSERAWLTLFEELFALGEPYADLWLGGHDRAHLAVAAGAHAVHSGFRSLPPARLRGRFGDGRAYGLSTHAGDDRGTWEGADYLFHGPVRDTASKRSLLEPIGFEGLRAAVHDAACPVLAIGGLRPQDVGPALDAGAHGVAVLSGVLGAADPARAAGAYLDALAHAGSTP